MSPGVHAVQGILSGAALYPVFGTDAVIFGLSVILIDADHLLEYVLDTRDLSLRGFFVFYDILVRNLDKGYFGLSLFHTAECYLLGLVVAQWAPFCYPVVAGFLFHHLFDLVFLWRKGIPFAKAWSVTDYLIRRKRHVHSIAQVLAHPGVDVKGIRDIELWKERWGAAQ